MFSFVGQLDIEECFRNNNIHRNYESQSESDPEPSEELIKTYNLLKPPPFEVDEEFLNTNRKPKLLPKPEEVACSNSFLCLQSSSSEESDENEGTTRGKHQTLPCKQIEINLDSALPTCINNNVITFTSDQKASMDIGGSSTIGRDCGQAASGNLVSNTHDFIKRDRVITPKKKRKKKNSPNKFVANANLNSDDKNGVEIVGENEEFSSLEVDERETAKLDVAASTSRVLPSNLEDLATSPNDVNEEVISSKKKRKKKKKSKDEIVIDENSNSSGTVIEKMSEDCMKLSIHDGILKVNENEKEKFLKVFTNSMNYVLRHENLATASIANIFENEENERIVSIIRKRSTKKFPDTPISNMHFINEIIHEFFNKYLPIHFKELASMLGINGTDDVPQGGSKLEGENLTSATSPNVEETVISRKKKRKNKKKSNKSELGNVKLSSVDKMNVEIVGKNGEILSMENFDSDSIKYVVVNSTKKGLPSVLCSLQDFASLSREHYASEGKVFSCKKNRDKNEISQNELIAVAKKNSDSKIDVVKIAENYVKSAINDGILSVEDKDDKKRIISFFANSMNYVLQHENSPSAAPVGNYFENEDNIISIANKRSLQKYQGAPISNLQFIINIINEYLPNKITKQVVYDKDSGIIRVKSDQEGGNLQTTSANEDKTISSKKKKKKKKKSHAEVVTNANLNGVNKTGEDVLLLEGNEKERLKSDLANDVLQGGKCQLEEENLTSPTSLNDEETEISSKKKRKSKNKSQSELGDDATVNSGDKIDVEVAGKSLENEKVLLVDSNGKETVSCSKSGSAINEDLQGVKSNLKVKNFDSVRLRNADCVSEGQDVPTKKKRKKKLKQSEISLESLLAENNNKEAWISDLVIGNDFVSRGVQCNLGGAVETADAELPEKKIVSDDQRRKQKWNNELAANISKVTSSNEMLRNFFVEVTKIIANEKERISVTSLLRDKMWILLVYSKTVEIIGNEMVLHRAARNTTDDKSASRRSADDFSRAVKLISGKDSLVNNSVKVSHRYENKLTAAIKRSLGSNVKLKAFIAKSIVNMMPNFSHEFIHPEKNKEVLKSKESILVPGPSTSGSTKSTSDSTKSTSASTKSTSDITKSTSGSTKSTSDSTKSTTASTKSTSDITKSTSDSTKSTSDSTKSTSASTKSTSDNTKSTSASTKSTSDITKSTSASTKSTSDSTKSTSASTKSTSDITKSTSASTKSTSNITKSTSDSTKSTSDSTKSTSDSIKLSSGSTKQEDQIVSCKKSEEQKLKTENKKGGFFSKELRFPDRAKFDSCFPEASKNEQDLFVNDDFYEDMSDFDDFFEEDEQYVSYTKCPEQQQVPVKYRDIRSSLPENVSTEPASKKYLDRLEKLYCGIEKSKRPSVLVDDLDLEETTFAKYRSSNRLQQFVLFKDSNLVSTIVDNNGLKLEMIEIDLNKRKPRVGIYKPLFFKIFSFFRNSLGFIVSSCVILYYLIAVN